MDAKQILREYFSKLLMNFTIAFNEGYSPAISAKLSSGIICFDCESKDGLFDLFINTSLLSTIAAKHGIHINSADENLISYEARVSAIYNIMRTYSNLSETASLFHASVDAAHSSINELHKSTEKHLY